MAVQLPLGLQLRDKATFANFIAGANQQALLACQTVLQPLSSPFLYLAGSKGSGRTHLLQACCHQAGEQQASAIYLPLAEYLQFSPEIFEQMETYQLICLDDIDAIIGLADWEEALFHLYNRVQQQDSRLVLTASCAPLRLPARLPDLQSRLSACLTFTVKPLSDEEKKSALKLRAKARGLSLSEEVSQFIFRRCERDMSSLLAAIDKLDKASLVAQKRLTIPFVKSVLGI